MKVLIIGGHLSPAFSLVEELEKEKNIKIVFVGRKYSTEGQRTISAEVKIAKDKNIHFRNITTGRLQRKFTRHTIPSLLKIPVGLIQSFIVLIQEKPDIIVSFGSYVSTPVVLIGALLGIDIISHEQASVPGLATRINYLFSKKLFLTWEQSRKYFKNQAKLEVIGNLVRGPFYKKSYRIKKQLTEFLKKGREDLIFITGGNQGSHFLNNLIFRNINFFTEHRVVHQIGLANYGNDHFIAKNIKEANYFQVQYLQAADYAVCLNESKLVVTRSGANTVWELILAKKPSILIPLAISGYGEQQENAKICEEAGFGIVIPQAEATDNKVKSSVETILKNYNEFARNAEEFEKTLPKDANKKLKDYILRYTNS
ncbi:UDP-N-acetylglucosamine--N-acetylmuramyl-(pentapeptide) pyrophosphoryl-undecaprenol N-acetylglucosamine transferase [Candidatus Curtissbacteria bacterium]|nr:UDP-N-acetylglucosamine--N-acetylmuramyl-(pentapeptide) pyrophosphoryl-undecaprenol N-acetylglucosamine transferase [Candidatus Curtissbacteria bacterium]